jgi:hypothetical protein
VRATASSSAPMSHGENTTESFVHVCFTISTRLTRSCFSLAIVQRYGFSSLCLSAIAWSGFPHVFYLFSYQDTRDAFSIPHDIDILASVFPRQTCSHSDSDSPPSSSSEQQQIHDDSSALYNRENKFFHARSLADLVGDLEDETERGEMERWMREVRSDYDALAKIYEKNKGQAEIPLA